MSVYLLVALAAWPVLAVVFALRLATLRRGPSWSTVAALAALAALVWPLALVLIYATSGRRP